MDRGSSRWRYASVAIGLLTGLAMVRGAFGQEGCTGSGCHASLVAKATVHPATESCDVCHESVGAPHPGGEGAQFRLTQDPPELCADCHDLGGPETSIHPPFEEGSCLSCHDPHATEAPRLLRAAQRELCGECHGDLADTAFPHGPVSAGECTACHEPHRSAQSALVRAPLEELCGGCHTAIAGELHESDVHPALEAGCTTCHQPHGAARPKLLAEPQQELCAACHDDVTEKASGAAVRHPPATEQDGCTTCHQPHAAGRARLLREPQKELCLGCHDGIVRPSMKTLHAPVAEGECTACHDPHGSADAKLLVASFPEGHYVAYTGEQFALCFECHDRDMVAYPDTSFATEFRDGERNLHYVHVNDPRKGRSCALCHELHGSENERLIASTVPFGSWKLPLGFARTATGGSCAPGCHQPQAYDRENPVRPAD